MQWASRSKNSQKSSKRAPGFTIVELLIVVVVIAILAAVTIVAFNGVQAKAVEAALKADLANAAKQMEIAHISASSTQAYPTVLPTAVQPSNGVALSLAATADVNTFCVNAAVKSKPTIKYRYESGAIQTGSCSGAVIPGSERGAIQNILTDPAFGNISGTGWYVGVDNSTGVTLTTRTATASDPLPSSPVLVVTNTTATTSSWGMLQSKAIDVSQIKNGKTYYLSFYGRKTSNLYTGEMNLYQVSDPTYMNISIPGTWVRTVSTSWAKFENTVTATADGSGGNVLYEPITPSQFSTVGWSLEFQGFTLYEL